MNIRDALSILGIEANADPKAIKTAYRRACIKYHPDRNPAGLETMKAVNVAYQFLREIDYDGSERPIEETVDCHFGEALNAAINAVIGLDGIKIEVCGAWVWLSGETKPHKDRIKAAGYRWARKKQTWYFRPAASKSRNRGDWDMDEIRDKYGSTAINNAQSNRAMLNH